MKEIKRKIENLKMLGKTLSWCANRIPPEKIEFFMLRTGQIIQELARDMECALEALSGRMGRRV